MSSFDLTGFRAQALSEVRASGVPWRQEGILVLVEGGLGRLRWVSCGREGEDLQRSLFLGDTPLVVLGCGEYWCPTCQKLLSLGLGREHVDPEALDALRQVSSRIDAPLAAAVADLSPVLQLLDDGVYLVSRVPHHPTNGQGEPFWALSRHPRWLKASRQWYFSEHGLCAVASGYPSFLLPTQALDRCDWECAERYRAQIRSGAQLGGLAFWEEGFLSALLDGHHRATAALLEGVPLICLTITKAGGYWLMDGEKGLRVWNEHIPYSNLPEEAVRLLEKPLRPSHAELVPVLPAQEAAEASWHHHPRWGELVAAAGQYPEAMAAACSQVVGEVSDERIERLLDQGEKAIPELWIVLQSLSLSRDPRALGLALRIARAHLPALWEDAYLFLATQKTQAVRDFFLEFASQDGGPRPRLKEIADHYLAESKG